MPKKKKKQRKPYKPPKFIRVVQGEKFIQLLDEHGQPHTHKLPDVKKGKKS